MHQLIYSSAALAPFSETQLTDLLLVARTRNGNVGVTGMLVYDDGSFLQALEGDEAVLEDLYTRIARDERHHRMMLLLRRELPQRQFDQWQMGFASTKDLPKNLPGFSDYRRLRGNAVDAANAASRLLGAFCAGRFRSYVRV